ncbi:MAG TPA: iron-siderophore ABC transporter substrate-binding protein [Nocardioidaceae bacterium]|nr:iron-siderophore ABC transporter substrate-binding protein [Nocardioidaceae bacterium]
MRVTTRLAAVLAVLLLAPLAACSTGPADAGSGPDATSEASGDATSSAHEGADPDAFPVTIEHAFGSTTIPELPQRVATVSWVNADVALALGVVPVGMPTDEWGANAHGSTPWKDAALKEAGAALGTPDAPEQYSEADGINFTAIAQTQPDVILAAYSGLTREDYEKLSDIAPVVAYPEVAYGTPWQQSTAMIGKALGRQPQAEQLVDDVEQSIADKVAEYPELEGTTFIYGNLEPASGAGINIYTAQDNRPRFLTSLGMEQAPVIRKASDDGEQFYLTWSQERADELVSDVFVTWVPEGVSVRDIEQDPLLGQIPAVENGALVAVPDNTLTLAVSAASPLSLPWAVDRYLPMLAEAARAANDANAADTAPADEPDAAADEAA